MTSESTARAFIALDINETVRAELAALLGAGRRLRAEVNWVQPDNLHLTLVFLGDLLPPTVDAVRTALDVAASDFAPFEFEVAGTGSFGNPRAPRVTWVGVHAGKASVGSLQARVAEEMRELGLYVEERDYVPHMTLGRVRSFRGAGEVADFVRAAQERSFGRVTADGVRLYGSSLSPSGPVYTLLHDARFGVAMP